MSRIQSILKSLSTYSAAIISVWILVSLKIYLKLFHAANRGEMISLTRLARETGEILSNKGASLEIREMWQP